MKLKCLILASITTFFTTLPAAADQWVFVARDHNDIDYYVDPEFVERRHNTVWFWQMSVFPEPDEKGILARKTYSAMICPLRAWRPVAIARFNVQGELITRTQLSDDEPLQFFTSGSVGEAIWKLVCQSEDFS